jgi:SAM-dependent methyltransferase
MNPRFDYGHYFVSVQDAEQMAQNLGAFVPFFKDCRRVLDLGCGAGSFLRALRDAGIDGVGVDGDSQTVQQAEASGLKVVKQDVLQFLQNSSETFDGVFCSHLVEHLPVEGVVDLVEGISRVTKAEGLLVMAFPNPESLEMQLFHFWLDPQHVRFYHPNLIEAMLRHYGFGVVETRFRHWRAGGTWSSRNGSDVANGSKHPRGLGRKAGRRLKEFLGITRLEHEVDYLTRLKKIGEEAVIVARKNSQDE